MSKFLKSLLFAGFAVLFIACGESKNENSAATQNAPQTQQGEHSQHNHAMHGEHAAQNSQHGQNAQNSANHAQGNHAGHSMPDHAAHAAAGYPGANHSNHAHAIDISKIDTSPKYKDGKKILRVFGTNPRLTLLLELLYPEGMIGLNYPPYPEDKEFMPENVALLPVLGGMQRLNFETLVSLKPDLVIFMREMDDAFIEPYQKLGIRTLKVSADFADVEETLPILGEALGVSERAQKLLKFHQKHKARLAELRAKVAKKPRIYFAYGFEGKLTECVSEGQTDDPATMMGAENVIKCPQNRISPRDGYPTNFEIVMAQNPEVIFVREIGLYKELLEKPSGEWAKLAAVQNKRLIYAPSSPSNWVTRPPTAMRIIGYPWAFAKLHPDLLSEAEAKKIAQEFFAQFLRPLSDEAYKRLEAR